METSTKVKTGNVAASSRDGANETHKSANFFTILLRALHGGCPWSKYSIFVKRLCELSC